MKSPDLLTRLEALAIDEPEVAALIAENAKLRAERDWFRNGLHSITMLTDTNSLSTAQNIARERLYGTLKGSKP